MKYFTFTLIMLFIFATSESYAKGPFNLNKSDLNIGIGLGSHVYGNTSTIPPISASYEVGFPWKINDITKNISLGGYLGYAMSESDWSWGTYTYTEIIIGARGSYHFYNEDNIDAYGGLMIGYDIFSSSYKSKTGYADYNWSDNGSSGLTYSAYLGGRYFFSESFGAFAELGYGIAYLNLGITMKF